MNADRKGVDGAQAICERFDAVLPQLVGLDGEESTLSPGEKEALLRHVEVCARCADTRRAYAATVDLLRGLPRKNAPSDFLAWVRADLPETSGLAVLRRRSRKPWLAIAAALPLVAAVIYFAWIEGKPPVPEIAMAPAPSASRASPDRAGEAAPPPLEPQAELRELDLPRDADAARIGEAPPRSPPADEVIVLALPYVSGRWESDLESLEREVMGRFVDPPRDGPGPPAWRRSMPPSPGAPKAVARSAPPEGSDPEASSQALTDRAEPPSAERRAFEPDGPRAVDTAAEGSAAGAPEVRVITVSVDPARLPELRSFVDGWSPPRLRVQMRRARPGADLQVEEKLEASPPPRQPVTVRIRIEPRPAASPDPKSP